MDFEEAGFISLRLYASPMLSAFCAFFISTPIFHTFHMKIRFWEGQLQLMHVFLCNLRHSEYLEGYQSLEEKIKNT